MRCHKITRISRDIRSITDSRILEKAFSEKRIIFTFDKGFTSNQKKEILVNVVVIARSPSINCSG